MSTSIGTNTEIILNFLKDVSKGILNNRDDIFYFYFTTRILNRDPEDDEEIERSTRELSLIVNFLNEDAVYNSVYLLTQCAFELSTGQCERNTCSRKCNEIVDALANYYGRGGDLLEIKSSIGLSMIHLAAAFGSLPLLKFLVENCTSGARILLSNFEEIDDHEVPNDGLEEDMDYYWPLVTSLFNIGEPTAAGYILKNGESRKELRDYVIEKLREMEAEDIALAREVVRTDDQLNLALAVSDLLSQEDERLRRRH